MRQTKNSSTKNINLQCYWGICLKCMQTGTQELRITKAGNNKNQRQHSHRKTPKVMMDGANWKREAATKKSMVRRIIWLKLPHEVREDKAVNRDGSGTQDPFAKMTWEKRGHQGWTTAIRRINLQSHLRRTTSSSGRKHQTERHAHR